LGRAKYFTCNYNEGTLTIRGYKMEDSREDGRAIW
jgi:hypothetical protein